MTRPKLTKTKVIKVSRLLNMMYKPAEVAKELGVAVRTIYRSYLPSGAPCMRDAKGNVWIHGESFASWAQAYLDNRTSMGRARVAKEKMENGQVYCLHCNLVVRPAELHTGRPNGVGVSNVTGKCPICGKKVFRFINAAPKQTAVNDG